MPTPTHTTGTGGLSAEMKTFYNRNLLENAEPRLVHLQFGKEYDIPEGAGKTQEWRKWAPLPSVSAALTEGAPGAENTFSYSTVTVTINQYGAWMSGSDLLVLTTFDDVLNDMTEAQGAQAGRSLDEITRDVLVAGTNVRYASTAVSRVTVAAGMKFTSGEIALARRTMLNNLAEPFDGEMYSAIIHPNTEYDMLLDSSIVAVLNAGYKGGQALLKGEIGQYLGVRFVRSTNAKVFTGAGAGGINVYATLFFGKNSFGIAKLAGQNTIEHIFHPIGDGSGDPLNMYWTSGWKTTHAVQILQQSFMLRVEHAVTP
jgi:N4-gp56 family major capsid protein